MKKIALLLAALLPLFAACDQKQPATVKVMSYNIRYGTADDGDHVWSNRREAAAAMVLDQHPLVFGVQEALDFQLAYLKENCPGYDFVGVGREDGVSEGEHMAVFYDTERAQLENWGTYWLSETPEVPSFGWDAACKRTATWTLIKDLTTGQHFYFVNTHLDHVGKEARRNGLILLVERIGAMNPEGYPMILCGDFNVYPTDPCLNDLRGLMDDARITATSSDTGTTWHNWGKVDGTPGIDYIFYKGFKSCDSFQRVTKEYLGTPFVSDHYPVTAEFTY
jgi:endonuclease/exonuclease/phosphatase family metal-dependent hydrolase